MKRRPYIPPAARSRPALRLTAAAAEGRFRLPVCDACGRAQYPPREICRDCLGEALTWRDVDPAATLLCATTLRHSLDDYFRRRLPVSTASIKLDAGPVVIAHLAGDGLGPGDRVRVFARLDRSGQAALGAVAESSEKERLPMPDPNTEIKGRTVVITGATGGIGPELVRAFAGAGAARILACAREPAKLPKDAPAETVALDVTDSVSIAALASHADGVDILVNNAGVNTNQGLLDADDTAGARAEMEANYFGTLSVIRAFAPAMKTRGHGIIVNMLTILSHVTAPVMGSYCASKAAALALTEGARAELMPWGVRVIGVFPGAVDTRMTADYPPPKLTPRAVAAAVVRAIENGTEDAYVGAMAQDLHARIAEDRKAVERGMAAFLPEPQ